MARPNTSTAPSNPPTPSKPKFTVPRLTHLRQSRSHSHLRPSTSSSTTTSSSLNVPFNIPFNLNAIQQSLKSSPLAGGKSATAGRKALPAPSRGGGSGKRRPISGFFDLDGVPGLPDSKAKPKEENGEGQVPDSWDPTSTFAPAFVKPKNSIPGAGAGTVVVGAKGNAVGVGGGRGGEKRLGVEKPNRVGGYLASAPAHQITFTTSTNSSQTSIGSASLSASGEVDNQYTQQQHLAQQHQGYVQQQHQGHLQHHQQEYDNQHYNNHYAQQRYTEHQDRRLRKMSTPTHIRTVAVPSGLPMRSQSTRLGGTGGAQSTRALKPTHTTLSAASPVSEPLTSTGVPKPLVSPRTSSALVTPLKSALKAPKATSVPPELALEDSSPARPPVEFTLTDSSGLTDATGFINGTAATVEAVPRDSCELPDSSQRLGTNELLVESELPPGESGMHVESESASGLVAESSDYLPYACPTMDIVDAYAQFSPVRAEHHVHSEEPLQSDLSPAGPIAPSPSPSQSEHPHAQSEVPESEPLASSGVAYTREGANSKPERPPSESLLIQVELPPLEAGLPFEIDLPRSEESGSAGVDGSRGDASPRVQVGHGEMGASRKVQVADGDVDADVDMDVGTCEGGEVAPPRLELPPQLELSHMAGTTLDLSGTSDAEDTSDLPYTTTSSPPESDPTVSTSRSISTSTPPVESDLPYNNNPSMPPMTESPAQAPGTEADIESGTSPAESELPYTYTDTCTTTPLPLPPVIPPPSPLPIVIPPPSPLPIVIPPPSPLPIVIPPPSPLPPVIPPPSAVLIPSPKKPKRGPPQAPAQDQDQDQAIVGQREDGDRVHQVSDGPSNVVDEERVKELGGVHGKDLEDEQCELKGINESGDVHEKELEEIKEKDQPQTVGALIRYGTFNNIFETEGGGIGGGGGGPVGNSVGPSAGNGVSSSGSVSGGVGVSEAGGGVSASQARPTPRDKGIGNAVGFLGGAANRKSVAEGIAGGIAAGLQSAGKGGKPKKRGSKLGSLILGYFKSNSSASNSPTSSYSPSTSTPGLSTSHSLAPTPTSTPPLTPTTPNSKRSVSPNYANQGTSSTNSTNTKQSASSSNTKQSTTNSPNTKHRSSIPRPKFKFKRDPALTVQVTSTVTTTSVNVGYDPRGGVTREHDARASGYTREYASAPSSPTSACSSTFGHSSFGYGGGGGGVRGAKSAGLGVPPSPYGHGAPPASPHGYGSSSYTQGAPPSPYAPAPSSPYAPAPPSPYAPSPAPPSPYGKGSLTAPPSPYGKARELASSSAYGQMGGMSAPSSPRFHVSSLGKVDEEGA
ncbi:hypothetical protein CC1G_09081 [Coprinopsis cinerea okayama7|uniref:Uncharacterized protein n=1 Tax=Coprinopsis cinerea (strain Okayama-7 / 130 / ATCC MYA-4618 / FGSC 9003) TaxID=240176 RepID=A8P324_COPC7|nr:hypothetical protein CC1G_09081 [Coprinopsis cinerea okayama7\|eukprot:XP_001838453.1 hypothetical protein CC1G_09081 [Coprinopsis cinerea okayama7\